MLIPAEVTLTTISSSLAQVIALVTVIAAGFQINLHKGLIVVVAVQTSLS
jgi:hypothetical protein